MGLGSRDDRFGPVVDKGAGVNFSLIQMVTAAEPVSVEEAKAYARVEHATEDDLFAGWIKAARAEAEAYTKRQFVTATWRYGLEFFPRGAICLPRPRLITVASVVYADVHGVTQTLAADEYGIDADSEPGMIYPVNSWPVVKKRPGSVLITYTAGYGGAAAVPEGIKVAIKWLVGWWNENREASPEIPQAFYHLLDSFVTGEV